MNRILFAVFAISTLAVSAQGPNIKRPIWTYRAEPGEWKKGEVVTLVFDAVIDPDWYLYSSDFDPNLGPTVTTIEIKKHASFLLVGNLEAVNAKKKYDEIWKGDYTYFEKKGQFKQKVKLLSENPSISGIVSYQTCSYSQGICVPGEFSFGPSLPQGVKLAEVKKAEEPQNENKVDSVENGREKEASVSNIDTGKSTDKPPAKAEITPAKDVAADDDLWGTFWLALGAGFTALITPCVFPMVPMTVSYFTKSGGAGKKSRSKGIRDALVYGLSIVLIFTIPGLLVSYFIGNEFANWLSTHWLPNILFFAVFIVFAASFLGMFEIVLPHKWVNRMDKLAGNSSLGGIFFMAFTLVLVSFSCTGPVVSSVFIDASKGHFLKPTIAMLSFSSALAFPFVLFAIFPSWMSGLPRSGGWLNGVKVSLGFIELAAALKFLSIPDQTYHWGILDREVYLSLWIVIFALWGFYLLGKIKFSHDSDLPFLKVPRLFLAITIFSFVVYMIPGLWGAPLKALAGYLPPLESQDFKMGSGGTAREDVKGSENRKYADFLHLPHGISGFFDFQEASAHAKKVNKPIFIDFTGHGCVNCRKMEDGVWSDPQVLKRLKEDYVVVALYVDDKTALPENEWFTSPKDGKVKKTIGSLNIDFQERMYQGVAQPQYVLTDAEGNRLIKTDSYYNPDVASFIQFLEDGKKAYYSLQ